MIGRYNSLIVEILYGLSIMSDSEFDTLKGDYGVEVQELLSELKSIADSVYS